MRRLKVFVRGILFAFVQAWLRLQQLRAQTLGIWSTAKLLEPKSADELIGIQPHWRGVYLHKAGRAGEVFPVTVNPGGMFKARRLIATDGHGGLKTMITMILVGQRLQMPSATAGILTQCFDREAVGNDIDFDVCQSGLTIVFQIRFLVDCTWSAELWGEYREDVPDARLMNEDLERPVFVGHNDVLLDPVQESIENGMDEVIARGEST
jgi:hypothetical protein